MPTPRDGESQDDFHSRCMSKLVGDEGYDQDQANAICYSMWRESAEKESMITEQRDYPDTEQGAIEFAKNEYEFGRDAERVWAVPDPQVDGVWLVFIYNPNLPDDLTDVPGIAAIVVYLDEGDFEEAGNVKQLLNRHGPRELQQFAASLTKEFDIRYRVYEDGEGGYNLNLTYIEVGMDFENTGEGLAKRFNSENPDSDPILLLARRLSLPFSRFAHPGNEFHDETFESERELQAFIRELKDDLASFAMDFTVDHDREELITITGTTAVSALRESSTLPPKERLRLRQESFRSYWYKVYVVVDWDGKDFIDTEFLSLANYTEKPTDRDIYQTLNEIGAIRHQPRDAADFFYVESDADMRAIMVYSATEGTPQFILEMER